jgi:Tol biopolymer transport system component
LGSRLKTAVVGACFVVVLVGAAPADATFPGTNGKIAFTGNGLYVMNPDGSGQTPLVPGESPAWSPDGKKIAFTRSQGSNIDLFTMNADGSGQTDLTSLSGRAYEPAWSPDGTQIAYMHTDNCTPSDGTCQADLYTIGAGGGVIQAHLNPTNLNLDLFSGPSWSPDGSWIAFGALVPGATHDAIYKVRPDGSDITTVFDDPSGYNSDDPNWSPNGSRMVFTYLDSRIAVVNEDGSGFNLLTNPPPNSYDTRPAWSPDGQRIALTRGLNIYVMNSDGTNPTALTTMGNSYYPDWQPIPYTGYPRPRGASPMLSPLLPAYKQCAAPNDTHGAPLAFGSCNPSQQTSDFLTVGTPDSNGRAAGTVGSVRYTPVVGSSTNPADMKIDVNISGVLNKTVLTPYSGELSADVSVRITDKSNPPSPGAATMVDIPFPVTVTCAGSLCAVSTTANAVIPGAITAGQRAIWQLGQVQVYDGGADGLVATTDNTLFMDEGVFVP